MEQTTNHQLILEYIRTIATWPIIVFLSALIFLFTFKDALDQFIRNIGSLKFPWGEIQANQQQKKESPKEGSNLSDSYLILNKDQQEGLKKAIDELVATEARTSTEKAQLEREAQNAVKQLWETAKYWEFQYLNYYLVPNTKRVLKWFSTRPEGASSQLFHLMWEGAIVGSQSEREAILGALQAHNLIMLQGDLFQITERGIEFLSAFKI